MKLVYGIKDKPKFGKNLIYAFQQLLAIIAATILVPYLVNNISGQQLLSQSAALIGAGVGTIMYLLLTKFRSPVFLGSSFAFITPLCTAVVFGYWGIIIGSIIAGLVYVILAIIIKFAGTKWIDTLMPPVIIGPVVALIGLDLSKSAISNLSTGNAGSYSVISILVGLITFGVTIVASVKGNKTMRMLPFVMGVGAGYICATLITLIGYNALGYEYCRMIDFTIFKSVNNWSDWIPNLTFMHKFDFSASNFATLLIAFAPVAFVTFAEHIADHKNLSSIIEKDLLKDPGLHRTLLGDGIGTIAGSFFGGCPNTTYGESIGCVAITGNASISTIFTTSIMCIILAFFYPFILFVNTIPSCVIGGICIALYGFIAVSGLRMFKNVDLDNSKNLFIVSSILVTGIGGLNIIIGSITVSNIACALILGIITNLILRPNKATVIKTVEPCDNAKPEETMFGIIEEKDKKNK